MTTTRYCPACGLIGPLPVGKTQCCSYGPEGVQVSQAFIDAVQSRHKRKAPPPPRKIAPAPPAFKRTAPPPPRRDQFQSQTDYDRARDRYDGR